MKCQFPSDKATYGYIRQKDLLTILPFSPATLWRKVKAGTFVQPVKLSARITAWSKAEVRAGPVCLDSFYPKISGALRV